MRRVGALGWTELVVVLTVLVALQLLVGPAAAVGALLLFQYARLLYRLRFRGLRERVFPGLSGFDYFVSALSVAILLAGLLSLQLQGSPWWLAPCIFVLLGTPLYFALRFASIRAGSSVTLTADTIFRDD
jgi:hypothetical protein